MLVNPKPQGGRRRPQVDDDAPDIDDTTAPAPARRPGATIVMLLVVAAAAAGVWRLLDSRADLAPAATEKPQPLAREGRSVTVPERSAIRSRLAIAPVAEQDIKRDLVLPAMVEADP